MEAYFREGGALPRSPPFSRTYALMEYNKQQEEREGRLGSSKARKLPVLAPKRSTAHMRRTEWEVHRGEMVHATNAR